MTLVVCHGETSPDMMVAAIESIRRPVKVITMDVVWWEVAAHLGLPRYFYKEKLALMQFVLGKRAVALVVNGDHNSDTWSMVASMEAMSLVIFPVVHMEVA